MKTDKQSDDFWSRIGKPAQRALATAGYSKLEQFTKVSEANLSRLHGMGPKALEIIRQALADNGLSFKPKSD